MMFCSTKGVCNLGKCSGRELFLCSTGLLFGLWLLYLGAMKWIGGPGMFVGYIGTTFADTWLPGIMVTLTAWVILVAEPLLGLWLISGKCARCAWLATAGLMFMLAFGQTVLQQHATVANNWQFVILALACAALSDSTCCEKPAESD